MKNHVKSSFFVSFAVYLLFVITFTIIERGISSNIPRYELFWSYAEWFDGNSKLGKQILGNIAMFCPIGFFFAGILPREKSLLICVLAGFLFSCLIEGTQLVTMRGSFELDDLLNNTLGTLLGWVVYQIIGKRLSTWLGVIAIIVIAFFCYKNVDVSSNYPSALCFQVEKVSEHEITGFAFCYGRNTPQQFTLLLKSLATGAFIPAQVQYGLVREDVDAYFRCEYDYSRSGFSAQIGIDEGEYEFIVKFNPFLSIPTGVYISQAGIHYSPEEDFSLLHAENTDLEPIIKGGVLRVNRQDRHCMVYQYEGALYWIMDEGFLFEDDGTTKIQYQLHTTQKDNLPVKRLENKQYWDNLSVIFEEYELSGDFGPYRVMKHELPTVYSVSSITTGCYKNGEWLWMECFRPYYEFD